MKNNNQRLKCFIRKKISLILNNNFFIIVVKLERKLIFPLCIDIFLLNAHQLLIEVFNDIGLLYLYNI